MMKKRVFLLVSAFLSVGLLSAQQFEPKAAKDLQLPVVTEEEMITGFHESFGPGKNHVPAKTTNDRGNRYSAVIGKKILSDWVPESDQFKYQAEINTAFYSEKPDSLVLKQIKALDGNQAKADKLLQKIRAEVPAANYGTLFCNWYSGTFYLLYRPVPYMNFWVSPQISRYEVEKGILVSEQHINQNGIYRSESISPITTESGHPHWIDKTKYEYIYFSHDVNRSWREQTPKKQTNHLKFMETFSLLFYIQDDGLLRISPLLPEQLSSDQQELIKQLQQAIHSLPAWSFDYLYTIDGRIFPGRYLKAYYRSDENRWHFTDYINSRKDLPALSQKKESW